MVFIKHFWTAKQFLHILDAIHNREVSTAAEGVLESLEGEPVIVFGLLSSEFYPSQVPFSMPYLESIE